MSDNPYIHLGRPIHRFRHFYGRKAELSKLTNDIRNGQCVSVVGIRRIGKTSLLFQLLDPEARSAYDLRDEILCVYIGCEQLTGMSPGEVYAEILRRVHRQVSRHTEAGWLEKPEATLTYRGFEDDILRLREAGVNLVLLLDEFERLGGNPQLDVSFFLGLRALHTEHELTFAISSRRPIMELAFSHEDIISSPFPNIFDSIRVGLFTTSEARDLVRASGAFSSGIEDFLLGLTGGHPLALQYACHYAFERQQLAGPVLASDDRLVVWNQTREAMENHYRYYWRHLSADQKRVLAAPAYFAAQADDDLSVENLFRDLVTLGLLIQRSDGTHGYAGRALGEFVRREMARDKSLRVPAPGDLVGQTLGQYQITARLGAGNMADVYKAYQPSLDRAVAVKVMLPHIASDEGFSARFRREARAIASLRHPHIVQIHDFGQESGIYYMVMEYIPGENLKTHLQGITARGEQMPLDSALRVVSQIGEALQHAHEQGLLHRDVKPSNVMLASSGEAILTDFGLAKIIGGSQVTGSSIVGTPAYMAPEQIQGSSTIDRRADVYALGVTLYEMVTGELPFDADAPIGVILKHLQEPLPDPCESRPDLPGFIVRIIEKALAKKPGQRFQTVKEMLDALERGDVTFLTPRQRWGVLVGINHYQDPAISSLTVCANDVDLVCDALCATGGYERARLRLLTDDQGSRPTKNEILASLQAIAQSAAGNDLLLFYFSGHGIVEGNEGYLLPSDARYGVLADTSIPVGRVTEMMLQSEARAKVMILDACHSGAQIGKAPFAMSGEFIRRVFDEAEGMVVLASCKQGQVSWEWPEKRCSVFTHFVLTGLSGDADREGKGFVTMNDLARHVTDGVKLWSVQRGRVQTPTTQAQVVGDVVLVATCPERSWTSSGPD
jgi:serine/threonine protein kinase